MALAARLLELMSAPCSSGGRRLVFGVALQSRTRIPREWIYLVIKYEKNHQNMKKKRPVEAVEAVISLILLLSLVTGSVSGSGKRTNCVYEGDMLHCELRTLSTNSLGGQRNNTSSLLGNTASRAKHVYITCSEANSESILRTNHFGYLPNLKSLTVEACLVRKIPALAFSGLSGLTGLHFRQTGGSSHEKAKIILEIEADAFTGLNDLRLLNFTGNNLWTLPEASLCGLSSLTELNLSSNFIQDVTDLGFATSELNSCRLPLRTLDLSDNSFSTLPEQAFGQLRKLERLNLANNNLNVIHDKALGDLTSLVSLNMAHNQFVALPAHLLAEAKYLQELILNNNTLSVLAPGLFDDLEHLVVLNMSRNEIGNDWLTPDTFASLLRLVALDLSHNRLTKLDRSVLNPLTSLQILDLSYNRIHSVTGNTFLSQVNLHSLQLSNNIIDTLHNEAMAGLSVLSSLQLGNNRLSRLDQDVFKNCSSLVDLSLQGNMLVYVPEAIRQIKLLKTLDLGDNLLGKSLTTASLEGLGHLYGLRLAGNGILSLNASVFSHVPKLQVLNLADNELSKLDHGVFNEMSSLRMLRLDNNKLEELNGILAGQTELRFLNVSANRLQWFDYAFLPKTLEWLDIHANQIEDLGNYYRLWGDFSLRFLDASNNLIRSLEYLSLLPSLQMVNLASNKISNVEVSTFANKSNLRRMDLRSNNIERLPLAALNLDTRPKSVGSVSEATVQPRTEFLLGGNPFLCDCEMEWLQKINSMANHGHHGRVGDLDKIECRLYSQYGISPPVPILQVHKTQFVCPYQAHCFALCMCCDFFACDCRMQCPEGCSCFHDSTWSANVIQCSRRGHTDTPSLIPMDATSILLDGNNFTGMLESQAFIGRKRVRSLFLNASQIEAISNQTFNGLTELEVLHLEDNHIHNLEGHEFTNLTSLKELYLERNKLMVITDLTFSTLVSLELLHLHDNLLNTYHIWQLGSNALLPSLTALTISGNPWSCQCKFVHSFQQFAKTRPHLIADLVHVKCVADTHGGLISLAKSGSENVTCSDTMAVTYHTSNKGGMMVNGPNGVIDVLPIAAAIIAVCVILAVASVLLFVFRTPLRVWLHSKYGIRVIKTVGGNSKSGHNGDKLYDAFVSYSVKDDDFVQQVLVPQLEHEEPSYKLCLQHRDLPTSSLITDAFPGVSQLCAKHLLIVSRSYLESEWTQIKYALQDHKQLAPIIILLEELSVLDLAAAPEFNLLLKAGPALKWSDAGFWNKLRFYLPDASRQRAYKRNLNSTNLGLRRGVESGNASPKQVNIGLGSANPATQGCGGWQYDGLLQHASSSNGSSSTSTRSTTLATNGKNFSMPSEARLMSNPMETYHPRGCIEDTYQSVVNEHIYHTLEPPHESSSGQAATVDGTVYDTLCKLDVMLPNGQMVPATLVRNAHGRIIPFVEVNSQTLPHHQQQQHPLQGSPVPVSFANTTKSRLMMSSAASPRSNNNRHFV